MRLHKIKAGETAGTYLIESPVTEADILLMAKQLASLRLRRGRQLTAPRDVFSHLQALLEAYEYEVFALLMLDSKHRVIAFTSCSGAPWMVQASTPGKSSRLPWSTTPPP